MADRAGATPAGLSFALGVWQSKGTTAAAPLVYVPYATVPRSGPELQATVEAVDVLSFSKRRYRRDDKAPEETARADWSVSFEALVVQVGKRIAELRRAMCLSQRELAKMMGTGERRIQQYESGVNLTLWTMHRIACALRVSVNDLTLPREGFEPRGRGRPPKGKG